MKLLDEVTGLKRRTIELLLSEHCRQLVQLDGLMVRREGVVVKDETWDKLTQQRVLVKPEPAPEEGVVIEEGAPTEVENNATMGNES